MNTLKAFILEIINMEKEICHHSVKTKLRTDGEKRALINRLKRIEGQIRGIVGMVERDVYCTDILTQAVAVSSAVSAFSRELLSSHISSCVVNDIKEDRPGAVDELLKTVLSLVR